MSGQEKVSNLFVWHQGALGDLLLAGPALAAISRHYPRARLIGVGKPACWNLLAGTLPLETVWDGGDAVWSGLFQEQGGFSVLLRERLAGIDLALVFSPRLRPELLARLVEGGVRQALWIPSFPKGGTEHVTTIQARRLGELGIPASPGPFRLRLQPGAGEETGFRPGERILAMAPGSGGSAKNWPLSGYYEVARALAWEARLKVVWLAGPAEEPVLPYIRGLAAAQGQAVWANQTLSQVTLLLARAQVYLGGDSGITHLAAAAGARRVVALFGPTDPRVWAPLGDHVTVLTPPGGAGQDRSLANLSSASVLAELRRFL